MRIIFILFFCSLFLLSNCQTVDNKSQKAIKKENEKLSKFLQQPESELKIVMGNRMQLHTIIKALNFLSIPKKSTILLVRESLKLIKMK